MRLASRIDVIAIAAGIAIILLAAHDQTYRTADDRTDCGSGTRADARKDGAGESARARADGGAGGGTGDCMVVSRRSRAAAKSKAARGCG